MIGVRIRIVLGALALVAVAAAAVGCGSSSKKSSSTTASSSSSSSSQSSSSQGGLAVTVADAGKGAKFTAPKGAKGGLTTLKVTNQGKQPHAAQLLLIKGNHTPKDVAKAFSGNDHSKNEWLRAEGGIGRVAPGQTASATVDLPAGHYLVADTSNQNGPPSFAEFDLAAGKAGSLPSTPTTVTAANPGKDRYRWDIKGPLKTGQQTLTFQSKGKEALHFIQAARIVGNVSKQQVVKALAGNKPPKFVDQQSFYDTAILDGGKSQVTPFTFDKPGRWVLFCSLSDRGETKSHFKEGLVKFVTVK